MNINVHELQNKKINIDNPNLIHDLIILMDNEYIPRSSVSF